MDTKFYFDFKNALIEDGYKHEIDWITNIQPCDTVNDFVGETIWVILNSGMKEQIARMIYNKIKQAWNESKPTSSAFGHKGKVSAIDYVRANGISLLRQYREADNKLEYLQTIPFIGSITKYHLAKNLGHDVIKPDRHLVRIAKEFGFWNCFEMCEAISKATGDKVSMVDMVLWRSANLGWI